MGKKYNENLSFIQGTFMESVKLNREEPFQNVYPFTTESISGYIDAMEVDGKKVLTVGSSADQVLNAVLKGSKDITLLDINKNAPKYMDKKIEALLKSREIDEFFWECLNIRNIPFAMDQLFGTNSLREMNAYMKDEETFKELQSKIGSANIQFREGSIFDFDNVVKDEMYDRIMFSNILQYIREFVGNVEPNKFLLDNFRSWDRHLNDEGILQLLYIYNGCRNFPGMSLAQMITALQEYQLSLVEFDSLDNHDSVVLYEKKLK